MKRLFFGFSCVALLALLLTISYAYGEDPPPPKDGGGNGGGEQPAATPTLNEEAAAYAKDFKATHKKKSSADVIECIDKIVVYLKSEQVDDEKVKSELIDCLGALSGHNDKLVVSTLMKKCGDIGEPALKIVLPVLNRELKAKVPDDKIYEAALESVGKIRSESPAVTKLLTDLLKNKEDAIIARAAFAISQYEGASGKIRRELFEEVLKNSEGVYSAQTGSNEPMKRKWQIIGEDMVLALNKLSNPPRKVADFANPAEARKWYNDNKKGSWDKAD